MKAFNSILGELSFLELRKDLAFDGFVLPQGLNIPIYTDRLEEKIKGGELDFSTKEVLEGVLSLYGADGDFRDKGFFKDFVSKLKPLIPFLYGIEDPFRALVMALGVINLEIDEKGIFLFAAERCNDLIKAGEDYSELALSLLDLEEESWPVFYHRGFLYYNDELYLEALKEWEEALSYELAQEIRDEIFSMMALADKKKDYILGRELLFKDRFEEARQTFASLLLDFPHWYELHFYYALSLRLLEEYTQALGVFYKLLQERADDIYLYNEIAICHLFQEEPQEAVGILERGLGLADNPDLRLNLAIALDQLGERDEALKEIARARSLAPDDGLIRHWEEHLGGGCSEASG